MRGLRIAWRPGKCTDDLTYMCSSAHLEGTAQGGQLSLQLVAVGDEGRPALVQRRQLLGHLRRGQSCRSVAAQMFFGCCV